MSVSRDLKEIKGMRDTYYPKSVEELKKIIQHARDNHLTVRTIGSEHSPPDAIYSQNEKQIKIKLEGSLSEIHQFEIDETKAVAKVTVGAGCYLGVNPRDKKSSWENSFNYQMDNKGFALPTLGGISHQTIAGFLSTSSSGGTAKHNIADVIEEIGFVDGLGEYHRTKRGEDLFNAVGVSMGLLGVITDVTLKLPKKYCVQGTEINTEMKDSCLMPDSSGAYTALNEALFLNEYVHLNWFAQKYTNRVSLWSGSAVDPETPITPYFHALSAKGQVLLAADVLSTTNILNETKGDNENVQKLIGNMLKPFVPIGEKGEQHFCDIWYKALPIDDQAPVDGLMDTSFSELWFPKENLNQVMDTLKKLFETNPKAAGNMVVELYCAKKSPFWMSPSYNHDVLRLDLYWWKYNLLGDANQYFGLFYEAFKDMPGVRFHWGKNLPHPGEKYGDYLFSEKYLQKNYPKLADFLKIREQMDPAQLFVTDYWRRLFSIPQPKPIVQPWGLWSALEYVPGVSYFFGAAKPIAPEDQAPLKEMKPTITLT